MKHKSLFLFLLMLLSALTACNRAGSGATPAEGVADGQLAANCAPADSGFYQLVDAAQGVCFHYPDNYQVSQGEDGSLSLYVRSPFNTEAPLASIMFEPANGRSPIDLISDYLPDFDPETGRPQMGELGGETAVILENLPGQDINRRIVALHNDEIINVMVARTSADYGAVAEAANALYQTIVDSFQFIAVQPGAVLMAGPECPAPVADSTLYRNEVAGYCLLLPAGFQVQEISPDAAHNEMAFYVDSLQNVSQPRLWIAVTDANGRSLDEVTMARQSDIEAALPGTTAVWGFGYRLDGIDANQFDQVPGQDLSRQVVAVRNGRVVTLTFTPDDPTTGDAYTAMESLYDTVMTSFNFLWE